MSNVSDFVIENSCLKEYKGSDGDVVIPDGIKDISNFAFQNVTLTSLTLPSSMYIAPYFIPEQKQLNRIFVAEGSRYFKSIDGVLYNADVTQLVLCPDGRTGELCVPHGVTEIKIGALDNCQINTLILPVTIEAIPNCSPKTLSSIKIEGNNLQYKSVDGILYDTKMETLVFYPAGRTGTFCVPNGVKCVILDSFCNAKSQQYQIHVHTGADVAFKVQFESLQGNNGHITIYAPIGSDAERTARRYDCKFEAEGEPIMADDSDERKDRTLKEWRLYFVISARKKGLNISKYIRGSKVVYLPDAMGTSEVGSIDKEAFPKDVAILCSKKLFAKLPQENKDKTVRKFLVDRSLFTENEQEYLLAYLKKERLHYLETYIANEDHDALRNCLDALPSVKTRVDECLEITARLNKNDMNFFLLSYKDGEAAKPTADQKKQQEQKYENAPTSNELSMPVAEAKKLYKLSIKDGKVTLSGYKGNASEITIPSRIGENIVTEIKFGAFENQDVLKKVVLPDSITKFGANAFYGCGNLETVVLPKGLTALEDRTFFRCEHLKEVSMPAALKKIGDSVFSHCPGLADENGFVIIKDCLYGYFGTAKNVVIPEKVKKIEACAFDGNAELESIQMPKSLKRIGSYAFQACHKLHSVILPAGLTGIGQGVFNECRSLQEISIPSGVKKFEGFTFAHCSNLKCIKMSANLTELDVHGERDFFGCNAFSIHAPAGSYAETYAKENNIPFVVE